MGKSIVRTFQGFKREVGILTDRLASIKHFSVSDADHGEGHCMISELHAYRDEFVMGKLCRCDSNVKPWLYS
jgi:hypothetical protein